MEDVCVSCGCPLPPGEARWWEDDTGEQVPMCADCHMDAAQAELAEVESERRNGHLSL